uniref:Amino acid transporter n=1 Tax=Sphenodon punctatus TaxID=8508 RepID=A0A8D0G706_SPHPU
MTKSNGEDPRSGTTMERFQQGVRKRTLMAKKKVQGITKDDVKSYLLRNFFVLFTIIGVIVGIILGFALRSYKMSYREVKYFSFPGELLMRMLQMLVLPLIVSSLVTGVAALDSKASGKMGLRAVIYYMSTTVIAVLIGIIMVVIIHPGKGSKEKMHREGKIVRVTAADAFLDLIRYAPLGILFLIAGKIVEMEDMGVIGGQLAMYTITVVIGLLIHAIIVLPLIYFFITRKNPWVFIGGLLQALITALGTSSRKLISFNCLSNNFLHNKLAYCFCVISLNSITATAASIGAAGIPQAGLVTMVIVLTSVGLPTDDITLIIAVDWFLDRLRTTTNVLGDSIGAGIVEHLSRHELRNKDAEMGNSVIEENEMKKPYQLISQENENEKPLDSETKM